MANRKGVFIGAYVPNELKESLRRRAAGEHRTLSQEITRILVEAVHGKGLPAGKSSPVGQAAPVSKDASGAAAKSWGTALPAGGGEPGKAYFAMHRATLAGDVNAMLALATKARAEEMRKARNQPEFPQMLEMIKAFEPAQVRILSGRADGNRAELEIDGKTSDGATMTGEVNLIREEGIWRIEKVSTESKSSDH